MGKKHLVLLFIALVPILASVSYALNNEPVSANTATSSTVTTPSDAPLAVQSSPTASASIAPVGDTATMTDEQKGYIGAATCKGCHETQYATYTRTVHAKKEVQGPEYKEACETCHGPGAKHVEKGGGRGVEIFDFGKKVNAKARSAKCLTCHEETKQLASWNMSKHKNEDVACDDCHAVHSGHTKLLKADQSSLCYTCHKDIRAQASRQSHHPIKEGKIACSSCHDPHGEFGDKMVKGSSVNELCYKCHAEKRGPFMWEHAPVAENCLNCHTPHGSNHGKLLTARTPRLCQSCHDWTQHPGSPYTSFETFPGTATGSKNRMIARSCLNCHSQIHGSNGPSTSGLHFVR
jgi:DmsE family decaheme c-type cytochrome